MPQVNVGGATTSAAGVDVSGSARAGVPAALELARAADVVVLALGIDKTVPPPSLGGRREDSADTRERSAPA